MTNPLEFVAKKTILVVDDTPDNLSLMSGLLKDLYRVKLANSGEKALKAVRSDSPPDLILLDIMMPGMSGHEVCEILKADPAVSHIPVIFLTRGRRLHHQAFQRNGSLGARRGASGSCSPPRG